MLADRLLGAITPQTKVLHFCHITNLTGPDLSGEADLRRGPRGAASRRSSTAPTPSRTSRSRCSDLGCDYYGTSLHKWLLAPIGTGFLYVRREHIESLWPLTPAARDARRPTSASSRRSARIRPPTTTPSPRRSRFHEGIGSERKAARLRYLRDRWAEATGAAPARPDPHQPRSGALLRDRHRADHRRADREGRRASLWEQWRIIATPIVHAEYEGVRVTPNVYTTLEEIDTFATAMERIAAKGPRSGGRSTYIWL